MHLGPLLHLGSFITFEASDQQTLVQKTLTQVKFTDRNDALRDKKKEIFPFVTTHNTYNQATPNLKNKNKNFELLATDSYGKYKREKSIKETMA